MAIRTYRWKPDTCECVITETHNDVAQTWSGVPETKCPAHASVPDNQLYGVLHANADSEQKRKNLVHAALLESNSFSETVNVGGVLQRQLKNGVRYAWQFTGTGANRVIEIILDPTGSDEHILNPNSAASKKLESDLVTLLNLNRAALNTSFTLLFGIGKVVIR